MRDIYDIPFDQLEAEIAAGGRFVVYHTVFSVIFMSFRVPTEVFYIPPGEKAGGKGVLYSLVTFVTGWWGFPFGPIFTVWSIFENLTGGKDVTYEIMGQMRESRHYANYMNELPDPDADPYADY